ncbi:MAG: hypothetical protein OEY14_04975 [Myxococcales bacterium]|nr:hypothetical protein [Myxococcales bacterium]
MSRPARGPQSAGAPLSPAARRPAHLGLALAIALLPLAPGCASDLPALSFGSTTPRHRQDLALGGAIRVGLGALREPIGAGSEVVAPLAGVRIGLARHLDLGLMVVGATARLALHRELVLEEASTRHGLLLGVAPYAGWLPDPEGGDGAGRMGLDLPATYALEIAGLAELWAGARLGLEWRRGQLAWAGSVAPGRAWILRAGVVAGAALGFRRLHAGIELSIGWEQQLRERGGASESIGGVVLTPAFVLRLRL